DAASRVTQVVRGQDLLDSTSRQAYLADLLGYARPEYLHVPLVVNQHGHRLSKRDQALAGGELWRTWGGPAGLVSGIGQSLGLLKPGETGDLDKLAARFDVMRLPKGPWVV
ncbi:MAG: glutamate--tRNA ligase family protein, partial [Micrococcales bacterium]|nr:glutamate--tRNA ligase family protein [Micrococcales bacterium]